MKNLVIRNDILSICSPQIKKFQYYEKFDIKSLIIGVLVVLLIVFFYERTIKLELLQYILVGSTVIYVFFTAMLFIENRKMREAQTEPELAIIIEPREEWVGILDIYIQNVGAGVAYDIKLGTDRDFSIGEKENPISKISYFKNGINCLAPGRELRLFSTITSMISNEQRDSPLRIGAVYQNSFRKKRSRDLFIDFSQFDDLSQIDKPVIYEIADSFKKLQEDVHKLYILLEDQIGGTNEDKARRWTKS